MIVILYQRGCHKTARAVAADIGHAFNAHVRVKLTPAHTPRPWGAESNWDDLLVVIYSDSHQFPATGDAFIQKFVADRPGSALLLPVSTSTSSTPPSAASTVKALPYDRAAKGPKGHLVNRIGCMLGLVAQRRDGNIFISYRAVDGKAAATQLHDHLAGLGHKVFLDEAKELDGFTKILPGSPVQKEIDEALEKSNLVLLVDTPSAPSSKWITHEVETADSLLLPILPICFRSPDDPKLGPRFRSLLALQRWVQIGSSNLSAPQPLNAPQLAMITSQAEEYLCEIFKRKCRVPFIVEKEFITRGFAWSVLDQRLLMFKSSKQNGFRLRTSVLSHCSIFDPQYNPAMKRFSEFLKASARHNHSLFLYDGELLPEPALHKLVEDAGEDFSHYPPSSRACGPHRF